MSKWSLFTVFLCATFLSSTLTAQWSEVNGMPQPQAQYPQGPPAQNPYPQSQYPAGDGGQPYPSSQNQQPPSQQGPVNPDPADLQHGVARVSVAQGDVNIQRGDNGQLTGAIINAPLGVHDQLQTSGGSRAEAQLDAVTLVRLAPNTAINFADLQYHRAQLQLGLGTIIFRVLQASPTQVEIDTPSVGFRALTPGEYRISVFDNGTSQISIHAGQGEILAPGGSDRLNAGRSVMVRGDAASPEMQDVTDNPRDQFDDWSGGRDQEIAASQSTQYVNTDVQGASDLDRYGNWVPSGYGQVWQPQGVAQDWSPYSNGQWSYSDYYGWTWIDYAPWGWAPYHYGRWFFNTGYGWCWWPGQRLYPSYYRPALVGFFGFGGVGVGVGIGALGWVALAPFEVFHPWWGVGGFGFRGGFGLAGYRNAGFRGGVLTASYNNFAGIHQRFGIANRSQIMSASGIGGRLPIANVRAGMNYAGRAAAPNARFSSVQSRSFYNSRGVSSSAAHGFAARPNASSSAGGWHSFGTPGPSSAAHSNFQGSESSGWHSFGTPLSGANRGNPASQPRPNYSTAPRSFSQPNYGQPRGGNYSAPRPSYSAPRQSYSAPRQSAPRASAPAPHAGSGGGGGHGGGGHSGGGGGHHR